MKTSCVRVRLGRRGYPIWIGSGLVDQAGLLMKRAGLGPQVAVITAGGASRYLGRLKKSLLQAGFRSWVIRVPDGEKAKTLAVATRVWRKLLNIGLERSSTLVALGGGAVGDLAGFVASSYLRGISLVHVPTTLLACVDSAIGGKTGVNLPEGKNLVGTFYQPRMVISDVSLLKSLNGRQLSVGFAESVKYGMIRDARLFVFMEKNIRDLRRCSVQPLLWLVKRASRIKAGVVARDERERNLRAILNYGHTLGHALEASSGFRMTHGEAISLGMMGAGHLACSRGWISHAVLARQARLLAAAGLPVRMKRISVQRVIRHLVYDKKRKGGRQCFVLPRRIGHVVLTNSVTPREIEGVLKDLKKELKP